MKSYLYLFISLFLFTACSNDDSSFVQQTEEDIIKYIADNNLNAIRSNTGLYYVINNEGNGARPTRGSNVIVAYKGTFLDGVIFDQSANGIPISLNQVIAGWTEGITYFKEGGNGILLVPSNLGYGNAGKGSIPGGAVLVFEISLIRVN